jgi:uncharacterized protein YodC (DUF2158 family)
MSETKRAQFIAGDVVRLRSGGPQLTVVGIDQYNPTVHVIGFVEHGLVREQVPASCLVLVVASPSAEAATPAPLFLSHEGILSGLERRLFDARLQMDLPAKRVSYDVAHALRKDAFLLYTVVFADELEHQIYLRDCVTSALLDFMVSQAQKRPREGGSTLEHWDRIVAQTYRRILKDPTLQHVVTALLPKNREIRSITRAPLPPGGDDE